MADRTHPTSAPTSRPGDPPALPPWAMVGERRLAHIVRVTALLDHWSHALGVPPEERQAWHDAGRWHDALRDADELALRELSGLPDRPVGMLHGHAAANRLRADGESRREVLDAIRWHTTGFADWAPVGRALYMADFLEPGRTFMQADRAFLASLVPARFDQVFRQVVRMRLEWALREGKGFAPESVSLWESVR